MQEIVIDQATYRIERDFNGTRSLEEAIVEYLLRRISEQSQLDEKADKML